LRSEPASVVDYRRIYEKTIRAELMLLRNSRNCRLTEFLTKIDKPRKHSTKIAENLRHSAGAEWKHAPESAELLSAATRAHSNISVSFDASQRDGRFRDLYKIRLEKTLAGLRLKPAGDGDTRTDMIAG